MVRARGRVSNLVRRQVISLSSKLSSEIDYLTEYLYQGSRSRGSSEAARGTRATPESELEIVSTRRLRTSLRVTYQSKQPTSACKKEKSYVLIWKKNHLDHIGTHHTLLVYCVPPVTDYFQPRKAIPDFFVHKQKMEVLHAAT